MLWGQDINLSFINYSQCHIDTLIEDACGIGSWFLTGIYRFPKVNQRVKTWDLLRKIDREAWLVLDDFNELLHHHEKWVGRSQLNRQIATFRNVWNDCALRDMGLGDQIYIE